MLSLPDLPQGICYAGLVYSPSEHSIFILGGESNRKCYQYDITTQKYSQIYHDYGNITVTPVGHSVLPIDYNCTKILTTGGHSYHNYLISVSKNVSIPPFRKFTFNKLKLPVSFRIRYSQGNSATIVKYKKIISKKTNPFFKKISNFLTQSSTESVKDENNEEIEEKVEEEFLYEIHILNSFYNNSDESYWHDGYHIYKEGKWSIGPKLPASMFFFFFEIASWRVFGESITGFKIV